jgi:hypothetical protein
LEVVANPVVRCTAWVGVIPDPSIATGLGHLKTGTRLSLIAAADLNRDPILSAEH